MYVRTHFAAVCNPYQVQLYEDFARSKAKKDVETSLTEEDKGEEGEREEEKKMEAPSTHIFQVQVTYMYSIVHFLQCVVVCKLCLVWKRVFLH